MVHSITISFVVDPVSIIDIAVNMSELSFTMSPIILPLAFVSSTIWPLLNTEAVSETSDPLAVISGSGLEGVCGSLLPFSIGVVSSVFTDGLPGFVQGEVSTVGPLLVHDESSVPSGEEATE